MKILLQINVVSNFLSTGTIVEDISKVAQQNGWITYVAYGRKSIKGVNKEIKIGNRLYSWLHYLENRLFDNEGLASRIATRKLVNQIKLLSPDIVHLHNIHDHYLNYQILFKYLNRTNIKVVWTFHDFWGITGHCHHFVDANCEKWKVECRQCPLQHSTVNSLLDCSNRNYRLKKQLFLNNKNLTIVPVSYWVGNLVRQSFLGNKRIEVIPNGVDVKSFKKSEDAIPNIPNDKFVILGVAREWSYGDRKGLDEYLKLSTLLDKDEIIVLVGMSQGLIQKMPSNIVGMPRTKNKDELSAIYSRADVVLSLSAAETFGLTVIEANLCGTPAIVFDNTAPPSLITCQTGFVVPNKNIEEVYNKIRVVKKNGKKAYSDACVNHVKKFYDKDINYMKYVDLYEDLLNENS